MPIYSRRHQPARRILAFLAIFVTACVQTSVHPIGNGRYMVVGEGGSAHSGHAVMREMLEKANAYCADRDAAAVVEEHGAEGGIFAPYGLSKTSGGQVVFRCE